MPDMVGLKVKLDNRLIVIAKESIELSRLYALEAKGLHSVFVVVFAFSVVVHAWRFGSAPNGWDAFWTLLAAYLLQRHTRRWLQIRTMLRRTQKTDG